MISRHPPSLPLVDRCISWCIATGPLVCPPNRLKAVCGAHQPHHLAFLAMQLDPVAVQQLQAILLGSRASTIKLIRRCPQMLEMERQELIVRLVGMKVLAGSAGFGCCRVGWAVPLLGWQAGSRPHGLERVACGALPDSRQGVPPRAHVPLQVLFPGADVACMVELAPAAFLDGPWPPKAQQLEAANQLLQKELDGADLNCMYQVIY